MYNDRVLTALVKKYKTSRVRLYGVSKAKGGEYWENTREVFVAIFYVFGIPVSFKVFSRLFSSFI